MEEYSRPAAEDLKLLIEALNAQGADYLERALDGLREQVKE